MGRFTFWWRRPGFAEMQSIALGFVGFMLAGVIVVFGQNWRMENDYTQ